MYKLFYNGRVLVADTLFDLCYDDFSELLDKFYKLDSFSSWSYEMLYKGYWLKVVKINPFYRHRSL